MGLFGGGEKVEMSDMIWSDPTLHLKLKIITNPTLPNQKILNLKFHKFLNKKKYLTQIPLKSIHIKTHVFAKRTTKN